MTETKYIFSGGLAFTEQSDMERLRELASEGWLLEKMHCLGYVLRRGRPQDIEYSLDYQKRPDEEYFSFFEMSGWTHVCSVGKEIHIFSAPAGTTPIHTDRLTAIDKYETQKQYMGNIALPTLVITILLSSVAMLSNYSWVPKGMGNTCGILSYLSSMVLIFTGMPYIGYSYKLSRLRKG